MFIRKHHLSLMKILHEICGRARKIHIPRKSALLPKLPDVFFQEHSLTLHELEIGCQAFTPLLTDAVSDPCGGHDVLKRPQDEERRHPDCFLKTDASFSQRG
jgi:hypothetical protein